MNRFRENLRRRVAVPGGTFDKSSECETYHQASEMPEDALGLKDCALFFDFDGTLAHIVDNPSTVSISDDIRNGLVNLQAASGGALAVVSGRSVEDLDLFLSPLKVDASGVHGLERRLHGNEIERAPIDSVAYAKLVGQVRAFVEGAPSGVIAEEKPGSVAIHYRMAPHFETRVQEMARRLANEIPGTTAMRGKMVAELRLGGRSKGDAINYFMEQQPYRGRTPLFFGDDVTDEDGFSAIAGHNGYGFKIGPGTTRARYRFATIEAFHGWLAEASRSGRVPLVANDLDEVESIGAMRAIGATR